MTDSRVPLAALPSVDRLLALSTALIAEFGRAEVTRAIRDALSELRERRAAVATDDAIHEAVARRLQTRAQSSLRRVFNLTGTVLHTNLGRAPLPPEAIEALARAAGSPSNLEYDLDAGRRGERDAHVEALLCELTGANAALVVNNNAAALLLVLNTFARGKEVPTSRGELVEIGGSFRIPEVMTRAGCRLREVGTTNRTHLRDFEEVIGARTGLVLKVHTSNYEIRGFTASAPERDLSSLCTSRGIPFVVDLGSGTLVDLARFGLPDEPTVSDALANGADLVTFSGDKLLGGPQAGLIVGRGELIARLAKNPMKRALRVDKLTLAALEAVLRLYRDPGRLVERMPTLRLLARPQDEIRASATRVLPALRSALGAGVEVELVDCASQVGSGAQPSRLIPSAGLAIAPAGGRLAAAFRRLPIPVIGRIHQRALLFDFRCLDDEAALVAQLDRLDRRQ